MAQSRGAEGQPGCLLRVEAETDAPYRSGPSKVWLKTKNPESAAVHAQAVKSGLIHFARSRYKRGEVLQAKHSASDAAVTTGTGIVTIAPRAAEACDDSAIF